MTVDLVSEFRFFGGRQITFRHPSVETGAMMQCSVFLPPETPGTAPPALWWLSGMTCTDQTFAQKGGAQRVASELGLALIMPDTSPRGVGLDGAPVPDGQDGEFDLGQGAGHYVDATEAPWATNYRMYTYVAQELPGVIADTFFVDLERQAISGDSMGGHGALMVGLKNPGRFSSISALAPLVSPSRSPLGRKAFSHYLGADEAAWRPFDATSLVEDGARSSEILIDQGLADAWLETDLLTGTFERACAMAGQPATVRYQAGYGHGFEFISTFVEHHLRWHAHRLGMG